MGKEAAKVSGSRLWTSMRRCRLVFGDEFPPKHGLAAHTDAPFYDLDSGENSQLAKFQGHPGKLSPKARIHLAAAKIFPSKFK